MAWLHLELTFCLLCFSSALDTDKTIKVAIKKLTRPFQSAIHARRTFREIKMLKHMNHENVSHSSQSHSLTHSLWRVNVNKKFSVLCVLSVTNWLGMVPDCMQRSVLFIVWLVHAVSVICSCWYGDSVSQCQYNQYCDDGHVVTVDYHSRNISLA